MRMFTSLRKHRGWARPEIFSGFLGFVALQLAIGGLLEFGPVVFRDPEYGSKLAELQRCLKANPGKSLVLVLGSSRTLYGLRCTRLKAVTEGSNTVVFNYGLAGAGPVQELAHLRSLFRAGVKPDLLLIELVPAVLNQRDAYPLEEGWLHGSRFQLRELLAASEYSYRPWRLRWQWGLSRTLPLCVQSQVRTRIMGAIGWSGSADDVPDAYYQFGYREVWQTVTPDDRMRFTALARSQYEDALGEFRLAARSVRALEEIVETCRNKQVPAAMILMPEGTEFRSLYSRQARTQIDAILARLSRAWGMPVFNASEWVGDDGFWDGHHMLPKGADEFTDRFGREVLTPLLKSRDAQWAAAGG
jgi:hypothetical protein